nr:MAG TPA: YceG-like family protein [Caudoviricetes sp.]
MHTPTSGYNTYRITGFHPTHTVQVLKVSVVLSFDFSLKIFILKRFL